MSSRAASRRRNAILLHAVLVPLAIVWLFPIWLMVVFASLPEQALYQPGVRLWPGTEFLANFRALEANTGFSRSIFNSVVVAVVYTALSILLTSMAGWALARYRFHGKGVVAGIVLGTMTLPFFVLVIPQFIMVARDFGLSNTWFALIVPPLFNALGVLFMRQTFITMPNDLFDAARVEGVTEWQIFTRVAIPMARPTMAALAIILFLSSWNNYLWPLLIATSPDMMTAPVALGSLIGLTQISWGGIMVGSVLLTVPMLILFIILQRHFVSGIANGAIK